MKINSVKIKNFKSLKSIDIKLNNLTLIAGVNSSGKSSFIQALLLIKENKNTLVNIISLGSSMNYDTHLNSGEYVELGNKRQLLSYNSSDDDICFTLISDKSKLHCIIKTKSNFDIGESNADHKENVLELLGIFNDKSFCYLKTDRMPPANDFPFSEEKILQGLIGLRGEYVAHYLAINNQKTLQIEALKHPESMTSQLLENTSKWLGEISNGVSISATPHLELQRVALSYKYDYQDGTSNNYSPLSVGFGLTYVLPVIVLILKSKPGDFIVIENPESHLHPAGQSKIAEMCAIAANNGVQIIVETHSDHFLNGLRVATKNGIIQPDKSQIYFFTKENLDTEAYPINIDENGNLNDYPKSFFDEWDNNLDKLLGL